MFSCGIASDLQHLKWRTVTVPKEFLERKFKPSSFCLFAAFPFVQYTGINRRSLRVARSRAQLLLSFGPAALTLQATTPSPMENELPKKAT